MRTPTRPANDGRDADGVRVVRRASGAPTYRLIAFAIAVPILVTIVAVAVIRRSGSGQRPADPGVAAMAAAEDEPAPVPAAPTVSRSPERVVPRRVAAPLVQDPAGIDATPTPKPETPLREIDAADA